MEVNERFIKVGKLPFGTELILGSTVIMKDSGIGGQEYLLTCVKIEEKDNQDGTMDVIYVLKY